MSQLPDRSLQKNKYLPSGDTNAAASFAGVLMPAPRLRAWVHSPRSRTLMYKSFFPAPFREGRLLEKRR